MNYQGVKQSKKTLLLKITSRQRPQILLDTVQFYIDLAANTNDMVWLFSLDEDCVCSKKEFRDKLTTRVYQSSHSFDNIHIVVGKSEGKIHAINRDINELEADWDILVNLSDDQRPIVKGWDDVIRRTMPDDLDSSLWFIDGQPRINTMEIQGRIYYNRFKYVYHPDFKSLWCDNLSTDLALFLGKCIRSNKQLFRHHHPAWGGSQSFKMDDLYRRNDKFWQQDKDTYHRIKNAGLEKLLK